MIDPPDIDDLGDARARNHAIPPLRPGQVGGVKTTFAEQAYRPRYSFQGIKPYIDAEARRAGYPDHSLRSRMHSNWFIAEASNALGNACRQRDPRAAQASLDRAVSLRGILAVALAAVDASILDVARELDLSQPPFARKPEVTNGPRKLRRSEHPGE